MTNQELFDSLIRRIDETDYIRVRQIPEIDLYMDQVTTFMDSRLETEKRYSEDKILTKTMINNYAKNRLLPSPTKKKYNREHMILLILIYYMKGFLTFKDIEEIFKPLNERYFGNEDGLHMTDIYEEVCNVCKGDLEKVKAEMLEYTEKVKEYFTEESDEDRELLQRFLLICQLCFDVYLKKQMIETIIDEMAKDAALKRIK